MTISSTVRIAGPYIGSGAATVFPFAFKVFAAAEMQVAKLNTTSNVETILVLNTDYTVQLNGDQNSTPGGTITLPAVLASGYNLTITSDIANLQPTDLTNQGGFYPEVITDALDRATIQIQQMGDDVTRSIKAPLSDDPLTMDMTLPVVADRINKILAFGATGMPTAVAQSPSSITGNTSIVGTLDVTGATTIQGITVGKGIGTNTTNTALGYVALSVNTTGINNTATGYGSLSSNTTGSQNTAFGYGTLDANLDGAYNTAIGVNALAANTTGIENTSVGSASLNANIAGYYNSAFGRSALLLNTGSNNNAFGRAALFLNTIGAQNCAFGTGALSANLSGNNMTAFGHNSLSANSTGGTCTAVGAGALSLSTGASNTAIGYSTGSTLTTGVNVTCLGYNAEPSTATVSNQVVLGNTSIGTLRCQVALTVVSDERDKTNIVDIPVGLNLISKIRPVSFEWNQRDGNRVGRKEFGFTAQQLQTAQTEIGIEVPYLVADENPEHLGASPSLLIPVLVKAIQELNAKFEAYVATHP